MTMGTYKGGALGYEIDESYAYADFERDMKAASELFLAIGNDDDKAMRIILDEPETVDAFGRATAYVERNSIHAG